jgi:hypothetical protein
MRYIPPGAGRPYRKVVVDSSAWKKNPAQLRVISNILCDPGFTSILLSGGSRSGKTFLLLYAMVVRALKHQSRHLIFRKYFNHAKLSIWHETLPKVMSVCFPGLPYHRNANDFFYEFKNGSTIWLAGLDQKERTEKVLGREFSTGLFDECSEMGFSEVQTASTRLAEKNPLRKMRYYTCNPPGKQHWSYKLFYRHLNPIDLQPVHNPDSYAYDTMNPEDNVDNIDKDYIDNILKPLSYRARMRYWKGLWLDDVPGALWTGDMIEKTRVASAPDTLEWVDVGVDPGVSTGEKSDATGIVTVGWRLGHCYALRDSTLKGSPLAWGTKVIDDYEELQADSVVGEVNNGGDLVESNVRAIDPHVKFIKVHASRGKAIRAEPVANLMEQGKFHIVGQLPDLEAEMTGWVDGCGWSPNRMDAMVWAAWRRMTVKKRARSLG